MASKSYNGLNVNGQKITSLGTPTASDDAATKAYADTKSAAVETITAKTGSFTFAAAEMDTLVTQNNSGATNATVPTNASVPITVGSKVRLGNIGSGTITITGAGITFVNAVGLKLTPGRGAVLQKIATDTWFVVGGLSA